MCAHESLVHRVEPAAGSGSVHDVVVDQRERVQQLERGTDVDDDRIVVAPSPDLADPVVATAWLFKRICQTVDVTALERFADERVGQGPEG